MSGSDGEDGRRERTTITGESGTVMGDSGCSAKIAVKQCANGEVPCDGFVGRNRDDSARMCADKAALNDDDRNMLLFPAAESTGVRGHFVDDSFSFIFMFTSKLINRGS